MTRPSYSFVRIFALLLFAALALASCKLRESDGVVLDRYKLSLNGSWKFRTDRTNVGEKQQWYLGSDIAKWDTITVPGSWDHLRRLSKYDGMGWYVRDFDAVLKKGISHALIFEGVDDNAVIWLNGVNIGSHQGSGQRFYFDVSNAVKEKGNVLAVRIEDVGGPGGLIGGVELRAFVNEEELLRSEFYAMKPVESPDWVRDAVVYEVNVRSFTKEGTFAALEQRLPELQELGVNVLWLKPIYPIGKIIQKGSLGSQLPAQDYYAVNPEFGTLEEFKSLVAAAHVQGLHVIIDLVANLTAMDNLLTAAHPEWYNRDAAGNIISSSVDGTEAAELNYDAPSLRTYMKEMMLYWVRDIGLDGFRCAMASQVPHDFWIDAAAALRDVKPVMMLTEETDPLLHIDAFDLTYAWNTSDMLQPILRGEVPAADIRPILLREKYLYPRGALHLRFSMNHDSTMSDAAPVVSYRPESARACAVLMHLLPGIPLIYSGQEVGSDKRFGPFEKEPIDWSSDSLGFRVLYTALNRLRASEQSVRIGDLHFVAVSDSTAVFAFTRSIDEASPVFTAVSLVDRETVFTCPLPDDLEGDVLLKLGSAKLSKDSLRITLPPYGYIIMK
ncbi:MAG: alpha-amylase family glycosyl hydrolase [Bacteroidota bacterium]